MTKDEHEWLSIALCQHEWLNVLFGASYRPTPRFLDALYRLSYLRLIEWGVIVP